MDISANILIEHRPTLDRYVSRFVDQYIGLGVHCTGAGPCGKQPIWFEQVCLFDVSLSSELTPYTFNTPVKLNDRAKFYTNVRQEDRKNKTKHLRLSGLTTRTTWSKTKTELIAQAQKLKRA